MVKAMQQVEVLRAACCVAGIDGHVAAAERRILRRLADEIGVGDASLTAMIERAENDKAFYAQQFKILKADPKQSMQLLFRVAVADGKLRKTEAVVVLRLAERLGVRRDTFDRWLAEAIDYLKGKIVARGK